MTKAARIGWWALLPCILLVGGWISLRNAHAFRFATDEGYLTTVGSIGRDAWFRFGFFLHVFGAVPVVFIGWLQFSDGLLRDYRAWHRGLGKVYVGLVLLAAAPGGFLIGLGAAGGLAGKACFVVMSLLWAFYTGRAWYRIHKRRDCGGRGDVGFDTEAAGRELRCCLHHDPRSIRLMFGCALATHPTCGFVTTPVLRV